MLIAKTKVTNRETNQVYPVSKIWFSFQLAEAGLRELEEETGLHLTTDMCENNQVTALAVWEVCMTDMLIYIVMRYTPYFQFREIHTVKSR